MSLNKTHPPNVFIFFFPSKLKIIFFNQLFFFFGRNIFFLLTILVMYTILNNFLHLPFYYVKTYLLTNILLQKKIKDPFGLSFWRCHFKMVISKRSFPNIRLFHNYLYIYFIWKFKFLHSTHIHFKKSHITISKITILK